MRFTKEEFISKLFGHNKYILENERVNQ